MYELGGSCVFGISEESRAAINSASDNLSEVTAKRAADHGFAYGDVRPAFTGHEICSSDPWLHSVTLPVTDSYHPTAAGQSGGYYPVMEDLSDRPAQARPGTTGRPTPHAWVCRQSPPAPRRSPSLAAGRCPQARHLAALSSRPNSPL